MFIGHFGVAFAAKGASPRTPLSVLLFASLWADMLCPILMLIGVEGAHVGGEGYMPVVYHFPYSHSLAALILWAILFTWVYKLRRKHSQGAIVVGILVLSHFLLDWITHRSGIQLFP